MNEYNFEVFKEKGSGRSTYKPDVAPHVSLDKSETIRINEAAYKAVGEPRWVEFLFDSEKQVLAIRACKTKRQHAYAVGKKSKNKIISAADLFRKYSISVDRTRRFRAEVREGLLIIDLQGPEAPYSHGKNGND